MKSIGHNTERYTVSLRIQSKCEKIRTRKNSVFGPFSRSGNLLQLLLAYQYIALEWMLLALLLSALIIGIEMNISLQAAFCLLKDLLNFLIFNLHDLALHLVSIFLDQCYLFCWLDQVYRTGCVVGSIGAVSVLLIPREYILRVSFSCLRLRYL